MSDRRVKVQRDERIVINREFESVEEFIREYVTNLSRSGAFIRSKTPLPVGTKCNLKFSVIMDEIETIEGIGEVVRVQKNPAGMGVVFVQLTEHSQDLIAKLLTRRSPSQSSMPAAQRAQPPPQQPSHGHGHGHAHAQVPAPAAAPSRTTDIVMTPGRPAAGAAPQQRPQDSGARVTRAMPGFGAGVAASSGSNLKGPGMPKGNLGQQPGGGSGGGGAGSGSGEVGSGKPATTLPPRGPGKETTNPRGSAPQQPGGGGRRARINTPPTITTPRATKK